MSVADAGGGVTPALAEQRAFLQGARNGVSYGDPIHFGTAGKVAYGPNRTWSCLLAMIIGEIRYPSGDAEYNARELWVSVPAGYELDAAASGMTLVRERAQSWAWRVDATGEGVSRTVARTQPRDLIVRINSAWSARDYKFVFRTTAATPATSR
ncbi:MAG TPA: hypothetical protein VEA69_05735 [Tepidisphaeraceae bacterium]|nr:hypothetical protein [Tepidisphaeraceae bacterium]